MSEEWRTRACHRASLASSRACSAFRSLMSQTKAIHGIVLLGGLIVVGYSTTLFGDVIGFVAIVFGTINVVGGFMVTDRMLEMFGTKKKKPKPEADTEAATSAEDSK